ncbi:MAG: hypothetical protein L0Z53_03730 [Acidobacteriales bacterium]|nr:hypothetical protein [Terriglobales bacterium]
MTYKKSLIIALAIVAPASLLLWLTFSPLLLVALYPGLKVQMLITAMQSTARGALLGLLCGAVMNTLLYSLVIILLAKIHQRLRRTA